MSKGRHILIRIVVIVLILAAIAYLCRGCGHNPGPDRSGDKKSVDSTIEKAIRDSILWGVQRDSIFKIVRFLQTGKDSLSKVIQEYKVDIRDKGADIQGLIDELNASEDAKDTLRALNACDSLKAQFTTAKALVLGYMVSNDSLASTNRHILTEKDTIIGHLSSLFNEANQNLFEVSRKYSLLYGDYQKINKPVKRWSLGPQFGIVLVSGKVSPAIGIGVQYSLFRF